MGLTATHHYPPTRAGRRPIADPITGRRFTPPRNHGDMVHRAETARTADNRGDDVAHRTGRAARIVAEASRAGFVIDRGIPIPLSDEIMTVLSRSRY